MKPLLEMRTNDSVIELELFDEVDTKDLKKSYVVYQDVKYEFRLKNIFNITNIEMIVNNENVDIVWWSEEEEYVIEISRNSALFLLTYGMTEIIVHVEFHDGDEWGVETNIRHGGRSEELTGDYETELLEIMKEWH